MARILPTDYDQPSLGACFTARDEQVRIAAAIAQVLPYTKEVAVIVDDRTQDQTAEVAQRMGAKVQFHTWNNSWCKAKNASADMLSTDWVLVCDCDELLEPSLLRIIPKLISVRGQFELIQERVLPDNKDVFDCYGFPRKNFLDGEPTDAYPDYQYRLFKNPIRYNEDENQVHQIITDFETQTEVDYTRTTLQEPARFNILHYKTRNEHDRQNAIYAELARQGVKV